MDANLSAKLKEYYDYSEKVYSLSTRLSQFLEDTYKELEGIDEKDDISAFLKKLAEEDIKRFNIELKKKIEKVNIPIRIVKKGFNKIYNEKLQEILDFLQYIIINLEKILKKIESFQEDLSDRRTSYESFKTFMNSYNEEINGYLKKAVKRITQEKISFFSIELEKLKKLEESEEIILFLRNFKANVNKFITEQLYNNIDGIYKSLKDTLYKKVEEYLDNNNIPENNKSIILFKIKTFLDSYENIYPLIYFDIPELPKDFFNPETEYTSTIDKLLDNIQSIRFFLFFGIGLIISLYGIYSTLDTGSDMGLFVSIIGIFIILMSIIDAMFFNKKYLKVFLSKRKEFLLRELKQNLEKIENSVYEFLLEQKMNLINSISEIVYEDLKIFSLGGEKIENLKKNIKQFKEEAYNLLKIVKDNLEKNVT